MACRKRNLKFKFLRVAKKKNGEVLVDVLGNLGGRGAYICNDVNCFELAKKKRCFNRAFKCEVNGYVYDLLETHIRC